MGVCSVSDSPLVGDNSLYNLFVQNMTVTPETKRRISYAMYTSSLISGHQESFQTLIISEKFSKTLYLFIKGGQILLHAIFGKIQFIEKWKIFINMQYQVCLSLKVDTITTINAD